MRGGMESDTGDETVSVGGTVNGKGKSGELVTSGLSGNSKKNVPVNDSTILSAPNEYGTILGCAGEVSAIG